MNTLRKAVGKQSVAEMEARFERVRRAQIDFQPVRTIAPGAEMGQDWASRAVRAMGESR